MLAAIRSAAVLGIDALDVTVEVDCAQGLPQFTVVGLATAAVKESRERVLAAIVNSGFALPQRRITVNLAPADTRKDGTSFDLPIALGLLVATGQIDADAVTRIAAIGELALDGAIRPVRGVLPVARRFARARDLTLVIPPANAPEARLVSDACLAAPASLAEAVTRLRRRSLEPLDRLPLEVAGDTSGPDLADVVGQASAKRALEIAAAGNHGLVFVGPPGAGKTLLARCLPGILPPLEEAEALEVLAIHSVAGLLGDERRLVSARPFRAPHHTISAAGLIGGGSTPRPGEVSLAHRGVLFLDEMLEFPRYTLDALRQPLEDGHVVIARAAGSVRYPAQFTLVGAMNPCPCGYAGNPSGRCTCSAAHILRYRTRLSGPLADRIDLHVVVAPVAVRQFADAGDRECSAKVRARVEQARERQRQRYAGREPGLSNGRAGGRWLEKHTPIAREARDLLGTAAERLGMSARSYHRVLRASRTIADLDGCDTVDATHVTEALCYRPAAAGGARGAGSE